MGFPAGAEMDELEVALAASSTVPPPWKMRSLDFEHIDLLAAVAESLLRESKWGRALTSLHIVIFHAKINGSDPIWEAASGPDSVDLNLVVVQEARTDPRENGGGRDERRVERGGREEAPGIDEGREEGGQGDAATGTGGRRWGSTRGSPRVVEQRSSFLLGGPAPNHGPNKGADRL
jgi:hypothetical protein